MISSVFYSLVIARLLLILYMKISGQTSTLFAEPCIARACQQADTAARNRSLKLAYLRPKLAMPMPVSVVPVVAVAVMVVVVVGSVSASLCESGG